jgi:hypothetical protein
MLLFIVITNSSLKDIYLRIFLSLLDLVALHYLIAAWVLSVMCKFETDICMQHKSWNSLGCWFLGCLMAPSAAELQH